MDALEILDDNRAEIESLCREYAVYSLRPCGLTAKGEFDLFSGDFQFVIEFEPAPQVAQFVDPYFAFKARVEVILAGTVDLFESGPAKNWLARYLQRDLEKTAIEWYSAR